MTGKITEKKSKCKVIVALSGGVDSAVAAYILKKQGHEVIAGFMKNWSFPSSSPFAKCCTWKDDYRSAVRVAAKLDIPFQMFDFQEEYGKKVIDYFFAEYQAGHTPNPDVMCNKMIKFDLFIKAAKKLGADFIATGHYVRKQKIKDQYQLLRGVDAKKDQSYFLWTLDQKQIKNSLFPVGDYQKAEIRKIAEEVGLPSAYRPDSQGICFVGEIDVQKFIETRLPKKTGEIILQNKVVGKHHGIQFFTIGQRKGLDDPHLQKNLAKIYQSKDIPALYIIKIDARRNQIIIGEEKDLLKKQMMVSTCHWTLGDFPENKKIEAQIRYQHKAISAKIKLTNSKKIEVIFSKPVRAITPGQSVVFYDHDVLLGGGIIK